MKKLKGLIHEFILIICIFSFCVCYFFCGTPMEVKASSDGLPFYFNDFILNMDTHSLSDTGKGDYKVSSSHIAYGLKKIFKAYPKLKDTKSYIFYVIKNRMNIVLYFRVPVEGDTLTLSKFNGSAEFKELLNDYAIIISDINGVQNLNDSVSLNPSGPTYYIYNHILVHTVNSTNIMPVAGHFDFNNVDGRYSGNSNYLPYNFNSETVNNQITFQQLYDWAMNDVVPDLTPSRGYCTFTWFEEHETVDDLLREIAIKPGQTGLNPFVRVTSSKQGSPTCEERGTKNLYNTGQFRIVNGFPEFVHEKQPCKDSQIPTGSNNFFYGSDVPDSSQSQYHPVCTHDNKTVYEYREGSTGGGLEPEKPNYGVFQPLVDFLEFVLAPITTLLNMFFGNFSSSLETLFKNLFVPSDTFFSKKWEGFYSKFSQKFPFIADIKPLVDSFVSMATNSNTRRPDFSITLPEFAGGQTVTIVDLRWFDEYRSMIHAGILFFTYSIFIFRLPRRISSAIGGTTS